MNEFEQPTNKELEARKQKIACLPKKKQVDLESLSEAKGKVMCIFCGAELVYDRPQGENS